MTPLTDDERQFVERNMGLVHYYLRRRRVSQPEWDDAWQDGLMGLMRAVQKFDPLREIKFSTYAFFWIRQFVQRGFDTRAGINFRYAKSRGLGYDDPISLDAFSDDSDDLYDWTGAYLADRTENVETRVEARAELSEFLDVMKDLRAGLTPDEWVTLVSEPCVTAERLGITRQCASARRTRLRRQLKDAVA